MLKRAARLPYCEDWACPSKWSCARAWGRSMEYWRFNPEADEREGVALYTGPRNPRRDDCEDYERDEPREWLKDAFTPMGPPQEPPPRGQPLRVVK